jgi:hypothetical protein
MDLNELREEDLQAFYKNVKENKCLEEISSPKSI